MAQENWQDVLKSQQEDLDRLEAMDAALNEDQISQDIDKILKRPVPSQPKYERQVPEPPIEDTVDSSLPTAVEDENSYDYQETAGPEAESASIGGDTAGGRSVNLEKAPETSDRMMRAKYTFMSKQLTAALELRKKMEEQTRDLQRQLKMEREEKKSAQKRISLLEAEVRKNSKRMPGNDATAVDKLTQDVNQLKKDLDTAQRIVKQSETNMKTKDSQLKRAAETISRLKTQLQESNNNLTSENGIDRSRAIAAESRVRLLEKQRAELMEGFRKQLKLIDILKRQKVHIEAARLLSFTEDEFMKTLDWKV